MGYPSSDTLWEFETANFKVKVEYSPEEDVDSIVRDMEEDTKNLCIEKIDSGEWQCFSTHAEVILKSTGQTLGESFLGGSIYADPQEFRDHIGINERSRRDGHNYGSYFSQLVRDAVAEARTNFLAMQNDVSKITINPEAATRIADEVKQESPGQSMTN